MKLFLFFLFFVYEFFEAGLGWLLSKTKKFHRLGIRFMAMSFFGSRFVPRCCRSECNGSCGNWTCPDFHNS